MQICFVWVLMIGGAVFVMVSLLRWFELTSDAVDEARWSRLFLLVAVPPTAWFFPSRVRAGRPDAVPRHQPVRGFGGLPKGGTREAVIPTALLPEMSTTATPPAARLSDGPPPSTPKEFIGMPVIPPKRTQNAIDPDKLAKLRQKMKEQGMINDEDPS